MRHGSSQVAPPGGAPMLRNALSGWAPADAETALCAALRERLGADRLSLHRSGREALRIALRTLAARSCRREVIVPAYTCYSVPAAVAAAGLEVRLVEVDVDGRIDPVAFGKLPLERAAAVVVCNLFGHCEPIRVWSGLAQQAGVAIIDDAAQALGAVSTEGAAGSRGSAGILSFGRGKPLAALGGGGCAWHKSSRDDPMESPPALAEQQQPVAAPRPNPFRAAAAAALHDIALQPWVFRQLKRVPALGIGETHFNPNFARGAIQGDCLALAAAQLPHLDRDAERRRESALALVPMLKSAGYVPLLGEMQSTSERSPAATVKARGVYPRLAVLAPNSTLRNRATSNLAKFGVGSLYPNAASNIEPLRSLRSSSDAFPVATDLSARLFTMNTTRSYTAKDLDELSRALETPHA